MHGSVEMIHILSLIWSLEQPFASARDRFGRAGRSCSSRGSEEIKKRREIRGRYRRRGEYERNEIMRERKEEEEKEREKGKEKEKEREHRFGRSR